MEDRDKTAMVGALMLVAGGIIGAGVALLFAPQSGKKTRQDIQKYARKAKRRAGDMVDDFSESVSELAEVVSEKASEILDKGKDVAGEARRELMRAIEDGQQKLEKQKSRLSKIIG